MVRRKHTDGLKAHMATGVKTNIVTGLEIT